MKIVYAAYSATPKAPLMRIKISKASHSKQSIVYNGMPFCKYSPRFYVASIVGHLMTSHAPSTNIGYIFSPVKIKTLAKLIEIATPFMPSSNLTTKYSLKHTYAMIPIK